MGTSASNNSRHVHSIAKQKITDWPYGSNPFGLDRSALGWLREMARNNKAALSETSVGPWGLITYR